MFSKTGGRVDDITARLDTMLSTLRNGDYVLTITQRKEHRTLSQNALLWLWLRCIEEETGNETDVLYNFFCAQFLRYVVVVDGVSVVGNKTSSQLTTDEFTVFLDKIQRYAAEELGGITLPSPEDRSFEMFYQTYKE